MSFRRPLCGLLQGVEVIEVHASCMQIGLFFLSWFCQFLAWLPPSHPTPLPFVYAPNPSVDSEPLIALRSQLIVCREHSCVDGVQLPIAMLLK